MYKKILLSFFIMLGSLTIRSTHVAADPYARQQGDVTPGDPETWCETSDTPGVSLGASGAFVSGQIESGPLAGQYAVQTELGRESNTHNIDGSVNATLTVAGLTPSSTSPASFTDENTLGSSFATTYFDNADDAAAFAAAINRGDGQVQEYNDTCGSDSAGNPDGSAASHQLDESTGTSTPEGCHPSQPIIHQAAGGGTGPDGAFEEGNQISVFAGLENMGNLPAGTIVTIRVVVGADENGEGGVEQIIPVNPTTLPPGGIQLDFPIGATDDIRSNDILIETLMATDQDGSIVNIDGLTGPSPDDPSVECGQGGQEGGGGAGGDDVSAQGASEGRGISAGQHNARRQAINTMISGRSRKLPEDIQYSGGITAQERQSKLIFTLGTLVIEGGPQIEILHAGQITGNITINIPIQEENLCHSENQRGRENIRDHRVGVIDNLDGYGGYLDGRKDLKDPGFGTDCAPMLTGPVFNNRIPYEKLKSNSGGITAAQYLDNEIQKRDPISTSCDGTQLLTISGGNTNCRDSPLAG